MRLPAARPRVLLPVASTALSLGLAPGCFEGDPPPPEREPTPSLPEALKEFYAEMHENALAFTVVDGDWDEDFGDAAFYGVAYYARVAGDDAELTARAEAARDHDLELVRQSNTVDGYYLAHMEEALMAGLGLIDYVDATGDTSVVDDIAEFVDMNNALVRGIGGYIPADLEAGAFAIQVYGPTTITAGVALLNLQYAKYLDTEDRDARITAAKYFVGRIDRQAWDEAGSRYLFAPGNERLYLYPNAMMMLVLTRLYELTDEVEYLDRVEGIVEAIQPLKDPNRGGYHSPYSAEEQGATTDDYSTLSSQNYITLAFALLYHATGDLAYFDEAMGVMEFVRTKIYDAEQGRILHHWIDGRIALPTDPSYWCSGCNIQFLYILWYFEEVVGTADGVPRA